MQSKENELGTRSVGRLLFSLALPAITAQVVNVLYNMVDRMYIGHIPVVGATALTGLGVTLPVILLVSAFATLASMGGAPPRLHYDGQGPQGGCRAYSGQLHHGPRGDGGAVDGGHPDLRPRGAADLRRRPGDHRLRMGLSGDLRAGYHRRAGGAGPERLHHRAGILPHQHAHGPHRRGTQHHSGPGFYLCAEHGRAGARHWPPSCHRRCRRCGWCAS